MLKEDFKGTGKMTGAAKTLNEVAHALNNVQIKMPRNYKGKPAVARVEGGKLVIDFTDSEFGT